jgi:Fe2+ or Zn2+ uptake regulation protein
MLSQQELFTQREVTCGVGNGTTNRVSERHAITVLHNIETTRLVERVQLRTKEVRFLVSHPKNPRVHQVCHECFKVASEAIDSLLRSVNEYSATYGFVPNLRPIITLSDCSSCARVPNTQTRLPELV